MNEETFIEMENIYGFIIGETYIIANKPVQVEEIEPDGIWVSNVVLH